MSPQKIIIDTDPGQSKFCACIQDNTCWSGGMDQTTKNCTGVVIVDNNTAI